MEVGMSWWEVWMGRVTCGGNLCELVDVGQCKWFACIPLAVLA